MLMFLDRCLDRAVYISFAASDNISSLRNVLGLQDFCSC